MLSHHSPTFMTPENPDTPDTVARYPLWRRIVKILLWTAMAAILLVAGTLVCLVTVLRPERLTPIVEKVANSYLDADVSVGRVELGLRASFPFLSLRVDSMCVVSRAMRALPAEKRVGLPAYADTLLTFRSLSGGVNLAALAKGEIDLSDIVLDAPAVNAVIAADGTANYNITIPSEESDTTSASLPELSISRFEIRDPQPLRYFDASAQPVPDSLIVRLRPAWLSGKDNPRYTLSFGGNLHMPALGEYNLWQLPFALDGDLRWDPAHPSRLQLENMSAAAAMLHSRFSADIDLSDPLTLRELDFTLDPVGIDTLLSCLPDSMARSMPLLQGLRTDAAASVAVRLTRPFNTAADTIPYADVSLDIAPCTVELGRSHLHDVEARIRAELRGNDLAAAILYVDRMHIAGPATDLTLKATLSDIGSDPYFDGALEGYSDLRRLPTQLLDLLGGSLRGTLRADLRLSGRPSMFSRDGFHNLLAKGSLRGEGLYWLADDTVRAAYVHRASLDFGTQERMKNDAVHVDSLLQANIALDSLNYLDHDISVNATGFSIGVAASNRRQSADTTAVIPMGGGLRIASLKVQSIADSLGMVSRGLSGRIVMRRYNGEARRPQFDVAIDASRLATGSPDMRFLLTDAHIDAHAHMLPPTARQQRIRHAADSLRRIHPELSLDSVYALAMAQHRKRPGARPRVHTAIDADDQEILEWGTSRGLARLLTRWKLSGKVTADRAGLYTPVFPLRNRVRNFNITFDTDSMHLNNVQYKVGHTDFTVSGRVTNIKRALTSRKGRQPLRLDFELVSDTVDVNQLAAATFAGAAYSQSRAAGRAAGMGSLQDIDSADDESTIAADAAAPDTLAGPLLIPTNIEAELRLRANNVIYSDLLLHNLTGEALMMNGRLNLHNLRAASDIGSVDLSALYSAPSVGDMQFGFGLVLKGFKIEPFLKLVPAIDSIMPLMRDFSGIIDANIAATVDVEPNMDLDLPTLNAAVRLEGDSLRLLDGKTYQTMAKWLLFKDKKHNLIDSMSVELVIDKGMMELFPFVFNLDRYRLGVQGYNDMALNFDYHVAVLKSPLPFKFGINLKGNPDKFKVRIGKARFNERTAVERPAIVDTTRVNLLRQIEGIFRRGVRNSRMAPLRVSSRPEAQTINLDADTISHADSLALIREGLIPAPPETVSQNEDKKRNR